MYARLVSFGRALGGRVPGITIRSSLPMPSFPDGDPIVDDAVLSARRLIDRGITDDRVGDSFSHYLDLGRRWEAARLEHGLMDLDHRSHLLLDAAQARAQASRREAIRLRAYAERLAQYSESIAYEEVSSHGIGGTRWREGYGTAGSGTHPGAANPGDGTRGVVTGDSASISDRGRSDTVAQPPGLAGVSGVRP